MTIQTGDLAANDLAGRLVAACGDAIVIADQKGRILLWNAGAEAMFGYPPVEALGHTLDLIIPEGLRARHWDGYDETMRTGVTRYANDLLAVPGVRRDGSRISLEFRVTLLAGTNGEPEAIAAVIRDVTQRRLTDKGLQEELRRLRQVADDQSALVTSQATSETDR